MADTVSPGARELTYGRALAGSLILSRIIRRWTANEECIGLLLPASVGGALANIAASMAGRVPVNLNFTAGADAIAAAIARCRIRTIVTSRVFLSKAGLEERDGMLFLEDLLHHVSPLKKLRAGLAVACLPASLLDRLFVHEKRADDLATVIFSSGSTGDPKGVMLSHRNVLSNISAAVQVFELTGSDVMLGVLPFFHSFGFTATIWLPLISGFSVVYHPNPMDAKTIGELAARYKATVIISTPTFCASYVRKIEPEQFAHLRYAIVGAEKLREPIALAFKEKFGLDLVEGYGCTEMAPVVAANAGVMRRGSVGRPLPGVAAKVVDPVTGEGPLIGREGLLLVSGPNRMLGYLGEPEQTREAFRDEWYVTGDIATIDEDGYICITDRLSRFSKIAGEMVPHMKIEEQIQAIIGDTYGCVVTAIADDVKGERIVAFHTHPTMTAPQLWDRLSATSMPKLWIPKREDLRFVAAIPTLGTGKVDLRAVRQFAQTRPGVNDNQTTPAFAKETR